MGGQEKPNVTYHEPLELTVAREVRAAGYKLPKPGEVSVRSIRSDGFSIGVVKGFIFKEAANVGDLYFEGYHPYDRSPSKDPKAWILEVYGREYVDELTIAISRIAQNHDANLEVRLRREEVRWDFSPATFK